MDRHAARVGAQRLTIAVSHELAIAVARQVEVAHEGIPRIGTMVSVPPFAIPIQPSPVVVPVSCVWRAIVSEVLTPTIRVAFTTRHARRVLTP